MSNFLQKHINLLSSNFTNPELELRVLLNNNSSVNKEIILSNFNIDDINILSFNKAFKRRLNREPISKIFNNKSFWKNNFFVNENVLDPRPESETIMESALKYFPNTKENLRILDLCTGSGCLAISLGKEYCNSKIVATDISNKAIEIAKLNSKKIGCENQIKFIKCDLIKDFDTYDLVVSNPPYISNKDYKKLSKEILIYEPKIALIAKENGYNFYKKIAKILPKILSNSSKAIIEIGSLQAEKTINIFKVNNINCLKIQKDIQNLDRVLILNKS